MIIIATMKKSIFIFCFFLISCEKFVTEVSDLTMSGKYVVSKLTVIQTSNPSSQNQEFLTGQTYINPILPDPFDTIKVSDFYIHFTYSNVMLGYLGNNFSGEVWKYGKGPQNYIFYHRVPWTFDAYTLGKIRFDYIPDNKNVVFPVILQVESDKFESLQLSGLEYSPTGANGTRYRLILSLIRVGP